MDLVGDNSPQERRASVAGRLVPPSHRNHLLDTHSYMDDTDTLLTEDVNDTESDNDDDDIHVTRNGVFYDGMWSYSEVYDLVQGSMSELEIEEYEKDSDFLSFVCTHGCEVIEDPMKITESVSDNTRRPSEITPRHLSEMDKQGIALQSTSSTYRALRRSRDKIFKRSFTAYEPSSAIPTRIFDFSATYTSPTPVLGHYQLRNLICPVSKNDIYVAQRGGSVIRLDPNAATTNTAMNSGEGDGRLGRTTDNNEVLTAQDTREMIISAIAADNEIVVAGGFHGEYSIRVLDNEQDSVHYGLLTYCYDGVTNHISLGHPSNEYLTVASNDCYVRTVDLAQSSPKVLSAVRYPWAINCTAASPTSPNLELMVGDTPTGFVRDNRVEEHGVTLSSSPSVVSKLYGHRDCGFACAWSRDYGANLIATGNQDGTVRLYDLRNPREALTVLPSYLNTAVRCLSFDSSGRYLAFAEPTDYVTIVDTSSSQFLMNERQVIDIWGAIVGLGFTDGPYDSARTLTVGCADQTVGGILQFDRLHHDQFLEEDNWW